MSNGIFLLLRDYVMLCYVRMSNFMFMMSEYRIKICKGVFHKLIDINTMESYKIVYSKNHLSYEFYEKQERGKKFRVIKSCNC